jgi:hypothetical protein
MAQKKNSSAVGDRRKKPRPSNAQLIKERTGHDASGFPPELRRILVEEFGLLHSPVSTARRPLEVLRPPAVESEYLRTGIGDYLFDDIDYAIIRFLFGVSDPAKVSKSRLKAWLTNKCNVPHSALKECSWPDISELSLYGIEAEYAAPKNRTHKTNRESVDKKPVDAAGTTERQDQPDNLVPFAVVERKYSVSRPTLQRAVEDGRLRSYRPAGCTKNHPHKVSEAAVAATWPPKPS